MALNSSDAEDLQAKVEEKQQELINSNNNSAEDMAASKARQLEKMRLAQQKFLMKLDEAELDEESTTENNFTTAFIESSHYNQQFTCPISKEPMRDPVSLEETGISYDRHALATTLLRESNPLCPVTRKPLPKGKNVSAMATNVALKNLISEAIEAFKNSPEGQKYKDIQYEPIAMVEESVSFEQPIAMVGESVTPSLETDKKKVAVTVGASTATFFASAGLTAKALAAQGSGYSQSVFCYSVMAGGAASWLTTALCAFGLFIIPSTYEKCTSNSPAQNGAPAVGAMEEENTLLNIQHSP